MSTSVSPIIQPRVHISLDVHDLARSIAFYRELFGVEPSKTRVDYAKFEPTSPALNLALNLVESGIEASARRETRVSHFGIQVPTQSAVADAASRLTSAGLDTMLEDQVTCCYAVQDKVWVRDPDGNDWEIFTVTQADTQEHSVGRVGPDFGCCPTAATPADAAEAEPRTSSCC